MIFHLLEEAVAELEVSMTAWAGSGSLGNGESGGSDGVASVVLFPLVVVCTAVTRLVGGASATDWKGSGNFG